MVYLPPSQHFTLPGPAEAGIPSQGEFTATPPVDARIQHGTTQPRFWALGYCVVLAWAWLLAVTARAQPAQPIHDPFMNLMLSQPKIDVDSPVVATATFEPSVIRPGDTAIYSVTLNALEPSIKWPDQLRASPGLELVNSAHGQILQMAFTNFQPRTTFHARAKASAPGEYTVPQFEIRVYEKAVTIPAATLRVADLPASSLPQSQRLILEVAQDHAFAGQPIRVRLVLPGTPGGMPQGLTQVQFNGEGFLADLTGAQQRIEVLPRAGSPQNVATFVYEASITPIAAGKIMVAAQAFAAGNRLTGPIIITGPGTTSIQNSFPQYTLLESDPVQFEVRALPKTGVLPGFTGAVGTFSIEPPKLSTNTLKAGEAAKLTVTVRGSGSISRLVAPRPPESRQWQVFAAPGDSVPPQVQQMQGFTTFKYTVIPLTEAARETPPIPFSIFDPAAERYVDLTIPGVPVQVLPGKVPGDWLALSAETSRNSEEKEPELSGLIPKPGRSVATLIPAQERAWFPILQLAPALAFVALWYWDRRRRYMEAHPEVLVRRRARKKLREHRRAMIRAAGVGDAPDFVKAAIEGMRAGCAPFFPARPEALVGKDVLEIVKHDLPDHQTEHAIRTLFQVADARRFGTAPGEAAGVFEQRTPLENVFGKLEEKLCA